MGHMWIEIGLGCEVAEIVYCFTHETTTVCGIRCHLGHYKVGLAQCSSLGVNANKDFSYLINIEAVIKLDNADLPIGNTLELADGFG